MPLRLTVETERESDGRWIAEVTEFAGVIAYGRSRGDAVKGVKTLPLRVAVERPEQSAASSHTKRTEAIQP